MMEGILLIDKPAGSTSQWVVQKVKKAVGVKKAGHTGTLDPLATGVLPVALGEGTKAVPFLEESVKVYEVWARLGVETDSYDADGQVLATQDPVGVTGEKILQELEKFSGEILQTPPAFSAVKVAGRPLYHYARQGRPVTVAPRKVRIHRLDLLHFAGSDFCLRVECSRGTYIRSLIHDLGKTLGCGASVTALKRLSSGPFSLESAIPLEGLLAGEDIAPGALWSLSQCLAHLPQLILRDPEEAQKIRQGLPLAALRPRLAGGGDSLGRFLLSFSDRALAVLKVEKTGEFRILRVFS